MKEIKKCPYCGEEIAATAQKCEYCGESLKAENSQTESKTMIVCPVCGEDVKEGTEACPYCHERIEKGSPTVIPNAEINNSPELTVKTELEEKRPGFFEYYFYDASIRHIINFTGEISRKQFWMGMLILYIFFAVFVLITEIFVHLDCAIWVSKSLLTLITISAILLNISLLSITIRRLHDCSWSGWWVLLLGPLTLPILICKGKTKCKRVKHNKTDFIIWGILGLLFLSLAAITVDHEASYSGEDPVLVSAVREEIDQSAKSSDTNDNKITIATYTDEVHQYKYSLKKNEYDQFENVLYQRIIDTGENFEFNLEDFNCGDNQVMISSISDYAVKDEKIVIIGTYDGTGMFAGDYVIFLDMSDETLNYVDFGHSAEFINNKTQIKVAHLTLTKEGDCEAENEYSTEETIYNL